MQQKATTAVPCSKMIVKIVRSWNIF